MAFRSKIIEVQTDFGPYKVKLEPEPDMGGYMVTAPKRPDVISWGKDLVHAKKMAKEALELSVEYEILDKARKRGTVTFRKQQVLA